MSLDAIFFHVEKFNNTPLLCIPLHVSYNFVRLPLCCRLPHGGKVQQNIVRKVRPLLPQHHHLPLMSWTNIVKWEALLLEPSSYHPSPELSVLLFVVLLLPASFITCREWHSEFLIKETGNLYFLFPSLPLPTTRPINRG